MEKDLIIKALECCVKVGGYRDAQYCNDCPLHEERCALLLPQNALALINELTEENERLRAEDKQSQILIKTLHDKLDEGYAKFVDEERAEERADTVRKFAEKITKHFDNSEAFTEMESDFIALEIDQIANEMLEGGTDG